MYLVIYPLPSTRTYYKVVKVGPIDQTADYYCDGVDDQDQINQAILDVQAHGGGTVFLRGGTYRIQDYINLYTGVDLIGENSNRDFLSIDGDELINRHGVAGISTMYFKVYGASNKSIKLENIRTNMDGTAALKYTWFQNNVTGGMWTQYFKNCSIENNLYVNYNSDPNYNTGCSLYISDCNILAFIQRPTVYSEILNTQIQQYSIFESGGGFIQKTYVIKNCRITTSLTLGGFATTNLFLENNTITLLDYSDGGVAVPTANAEIKNNIITTCWIRTANVKYVKLENNSIGAFTPPFPLPPSVMLYCNVDFSNNSWGDIEITDTAKGVVLKAPNGSRWRITLDNEGVMQTTSI